MRLYHRTTREAADAIRSGGFAESWVKDSAGGSWLAADPADCSTVGDSVVVVELSDDVAEPHRYFLAPGEPYLSCFLVPFDVLNAHRPFDVRPWESVAPPA